MRILAGEALKLIKTLVQMPPYFTRKRAFLFALLIFTTNRAWNYGDRLIEQFSASHTVLPSTLILFIIFFGITSFLLGYFISLEQNVKE
jgi:hypothetical protein